MSRENVCPLCREEFSSPLGVTNHKCRKVVAAKNMVYGMIYVGTPVGEFQRDRDGRYWWKKADGTIQEVKPHPDAVFTEYREVE